MAMIAMIVMAVQASDFWAPPKAIAATFLGDAAMQPGFAAGLVLIGLMFHMFNGAWLGALFGLITPGLPVGATAVTGVIFGIAVGLGALWLVLPVVDPVLAQSATQQLGIFWWLIVHAVFGLVTGSIRSLPAGRTSSERPTERRPTTTCPSPARGSHRALGTSLTSDQEASWMYGNFART